MCAQGPGLLSFSEAFCPFSQSDAAGIIVEKRLPKVLFYAEACVRSESRVHCRSGAPVRSISSEQGAFALHGPLMGFWA